MERMKLTIDGINASLRFSLPDGTIVERNFYASGGGIFEIFDGYEMPVCERLKRSGHVIRMMDTYKLADMLRRHYKMMRYDMMKAWNNAWLEHGYDATDYNGAG